MQSKGYFSRSEAFRDAVRGLISETELAALQIENVAATIAKSTASKSLCTGNNGRILTLVNRLRGMHGIQ